MSAVEDNTGDRSHLQILKSTAVIGGASLINIAFAIIRNKVTAVLLGPQGVGLMALYTSIADLTQALAGLGVQQSGVRQIAEAVGTSDQERINRTVVALRRVSLLLGLAGAALLAVFAYPVAELTFADQRLCHGGWDCRCRDLLPDRLGRSDIIDPGNAPGIGPCGHQCGRRLSEYRNQHSVDLLVRRGRHRVVDTCDVDRHAC